MQEEKSGATVEKYCREAARFAAWLPGWVEGGSLLWWMAAALLLGNGCNILVASGFPAWHIGFLPENIRGRFFALSGIVNSVFTALATLGASVLADAAKASGRQMYWMGV